VKPFVFFSIFLIFLSRSAFSQDAYTYKAVTVNIVLPEDTATRNACNSAARQLGLDPFEAEFLYQLNYCRLHPRQYASRAVKPFLKAYPQWAPVYGESLVANLDCLSQLSVLTPSASLLKLARAHAADLGSTDQMRHESADGTTTQQRFQREGVICGSECINMGGFPSAAEVLLSLLVDYGVTNTGHRKSLLSPKMRSVGIGAAFNRGGKIRYTVIDLGCD
jgi:hypothetical protein